MNHFDDPGPRAMLEPVLVPCSTCAALRARVAEMEAERLRFYHADGTFQVLSTPEEVIQRRTAAAVRLAWLEADRLKDPLCQALNEGDGTYRP